MALCKSCKKNTCSDCTCDFIELIGLCDPDSIYFTNPNSPRYKSDYNWIQVSVPALLELDENHLDVKSIASVFVNVSINSSKLIETPKVLQTKTVGPFTEYEIDNYGYPIPIPNEEGTFLTGRKLIIGGTISIKLVYEVCQDHKCRNSCEKNSSDLNSVKYEVPFSAYIIVYPKFLCDNFIVKDCVVDLNESFEIDSFVESAYAKPLGPKTLYSSILLFLKATPLI